MDTTTFAQKIKAKYPAYQNVDDANLVNKFLEKYPVYKSQVKTQSETGADIKQIGTDIAQTTETALNKFDTAKQRMETGQQGSLRTRLQQLGIGAGYASGVAGDILKGGVKAVLPQSAENVVKTGMQKALTPIVQSEPVQNIVSKYEQLKQTNPALAQDIDSLLGVGMLALDVAGAGAGAKGAAAGVETGISATKTGLKAGKQIAGDIATAGSEALSSAKNVIGDIVPKRSEIVSGQITKALDLTQGDVSNIKSATGNESGKWIAEKTPIAGNKAEQLKNISTFVDTQYKTVRDEIAKVTNKYTLEQLPRLKQSLVILQQQVKGVPGLEQTAKEVATIARKKSFTLNDVQRVKELLDDQFSLYKMTGDVKEGTIKKGLANVRKDIKKFIETEVRNTTGADISALNNDVATGESILELAEKRSTRDFTRANVSLSDLGAFGAGSVAGTPLVGAAALFAKRVIETPTVQLKIAKFLNKLSPEIKTKVADELISGKVPSILKKEVTQSLSLKPSSKSIKNINQTAGISKELPKTVKKSSNLSTLEQEAKKYKSAEEFVMAHTASDLMDLSNPEKHRIGRLFSEADDGKIMDTFDMANTYGSRGINEYKYQPDANVPDVKSPDDIVTIYRGTVKAQKKMLPGDFVSFSKDYAKMHNNGEKVLSLKVPAKDVIWQGNDLNEWVYSPKSIRDKYGSLEDIWNKANTDVNSLQEQIKELDGQISELSYYDSPEDNELFDNLIEERTKLESQLTDIWNKANKK